MQNCADWMKFGVGQSADILYVQSYAEVICDVETRILAEDKEISQPQTEMVVGLQTEKDLEDERMWRASVSLLFRYG